MLINIGLITAALISAISLFWLFTKISKHRNRLTPEQVANKIEDYINGTGGPWDWDHFLSIPIHDMRLDQIRLRCNELTSSASISAEKRQEFICIVQALRATNHRQ